jgi:hypothetical protein
MSFSVYLDGIEPARELATKLFVAVAEIEKNK